MPNEKKKIQVLQKDVNLIGGAKLPELGDTLYELGEGLSIDRKVVLSIKAGRVRSIPAPMSNVERVEFILTCLTPSSKGY